MVITALDTCPYIVTLYADFQHGRSGCITDTQVWVIDRRARPRVEYDCPVFGDVGLCREAVGELFVLFDEGHSLMLQSFLGFGWGFAFHRDAGVGRGGLQLGGGRE